VRCIRQLGVEIEELNGITRVKGQGIMGIQEPEDVVDCGNSGTTMRLLSGVVASRPFQTVLTGDESLRRRPMERIIEPLMMMGAGITGRQNSKLAPLLVRGGGLHGIEYRLPVASAQVKSAIILAALASEGETIIHEPVPSRDHTERMLRAMGANLSIEQSLIRINKSGDLHPLDIVVPGDISSAAFWMVAGIIVPGSEIMLRDVGLNPTRSGIIDILIKMGANIEIENLHMIGEEPVGNIIVRHSELHPVKVEGQVIPRLIDEIPVLAVAMAAANGVSEVRDAGDLRVKESYRIAMIVSSLTHLGVEAESLDDGFVINGNGSIPGGSIPVDSGGDHRIAMFLAVAGLISRVPITIEGFECVGISYPSFRKDMDKLLKQPV
ncbi:MAG: 3-phosphoshikimate 1-carboxyvinyltransferase, partial [Syntrophomonadaceae bacterium]|nr:3-phosphoshikimate 1-carboxyvinyltransferase [Syntrophomonadaceae bacterium]